MKNFLTRVKRWWTTAPPSLPTAVPFEVVCACGQKATGFRKATHQVVRCAGCGEELFILPLSRFPEVAPADAQPRRAAVPSWLPSALGPWGVPLFAALLTLLVLVAAYRFLISPLLSDRPRPDDPKTAAVEGGAEAFIAHLDDARKRIGLGHFRLALEKLQAAQGLCEQQPDACSPAQRRQLVQLTRQAELMVDRLAEPLEEVLRHAAGIQQTEWQADFRHRYRHKAVLFDVTIRPAGEDRYEVVYLLPVHEEWAHLEVNDLALLRRLQIQEPQRVLFGARLASISREPKRGWVVRLEADSGVLLTAAEVAIVCPYPPASPTEEEVRAVLQRQAEWAARE